MVSFTGFCIQIDNNPEFILFPNPANQNINIELRTDKEENINIKIHDLHGRILYTAAYTKPKGKTQYKIPLHDLKFGMYIIQVTVGEKLHTRKLLKQ